MKSQVNYDVLGEFLEYDDLQLEYDRVTNNIADVELPAGATIHGRWSEVMIKASSTGGAILYFGY